jgi:hypothetical protein
MTMVDFRTAITVRIAASCLLAWPVTGILSAVVFQPLPPLDSYSFLPWREAFAWVWKNLLGLPLYGGLFLGHFVFVVGLYLLAKLTNRSQPEPKSVIVAVSTLLAGITLKFASFTFFMGLHWEILLLVADSLVAISVIYLTRPRVKESSLVLKK